MLQDIVGSGSSQQLHIDNQWVTAAFGPYPTQPIGPVSAIMEVTAPHTKNTYTLQVVKGSHLQTLACEECGMEADNPDYTVRL